jgi:hypothetical protein
MSDQDQEAKAPEKEETPKKKTSGCVWAILIVVVIIILAGVFGSNKDTADSIQETGITSETPSQTESDIDLEEPKTEPIPKVTAKELWVAYDSNELAADKKYKDKKLILTGIIQNIGKDIVDTAYITLETDNSFQSVQCMFGKDEEEYLEILSKGQKVEVIGTCNGATITGGVLMVHCKLNL